MWLIVRASQSLSALTSCFSAVSPHRFRRGKRSNGGEKVDGKVHFLALERFPVAFQYPREWCGNPIYVTDVTFP